MIQQLYEQIHQLPSFNNKMRMKRQMLYAIMQAPIAYDDSVIEQIIKEHTKLCGPCEAFKFKGRKFDTQYWEGGVQPLHASLHIRMDHYIRMQKDASLLITTLDNFVGAVLLKAKTKADLLALLPSSMHNSALDVADMYLPQIIALCWHDTPTLSPEAIETFHKRHEATKVQLQILELTKLTN